jgi:hypothetical protein
LFNLSFDQVGAGFAEMNITWRLSTNQQRATNVTTAEHSTSNDVNDIFWYHCDSKVLICKEHNDSVQNLSTHLSEKHCTTLSQRRAIVQKYAQHERLPPRQVPLPSPEEPPIAALGPPLDGFLCHGYDCEFISINESTIRHHCNKAHGWTSSKDDKAYWQQVRVQTFFQNRALRRYFVVCEQEGSTEPVLLPSSATPARTPAKITLSDDAQGDLERIKSEWSAVRASHEKTLEQLEEDILQQDRTGWFNRTGWPEHLGKRHLRYLAHATRLPDRDEIVLQEAVRVVNLLMKQAVAGLSTFDIELRRWIKSTQQTEPDRRPIARLQNPESQDRYNGYIQRFVCYFLRVWISEQELS